jgi:hypothetical protein
VQFDGHDDMAIVAEELLSNRSAFTLAAWIRPSSLGGHQGILGQGGAIQLELLPTGNMRIWTAAGGQHTVVYPFTTDTWHHVAASGDGATIRVYYDGTLWGFSELTTSNYGASSASLAFGSVESPPGVWRRFSGSMDDVRIYETALSPTSIAFLATAPPANAPPTVDAGLDFSASAGVPTALLATVADDGLPAPPGQVAVLWSQALGQPNATINDPDRVFTLVTCPTAGTYVFEISVTDGDLTVWDEIVVEVTSPTGAQSGSIVEGLRPVGPNPFRTDTSISFGVAREGSPVRLALHDVTGRRVITLREGTFPIGEHRAAWNACDESGRRVAAGVYFVVLDVDGRRFVEKMALLR